MALLRAATTQFQHVPGDIEANLAIVGRLASRAAEQGAKIIAFPECCLSGYWHLRNLSREEFAAVSEPVPDGRSTQRLLALAKDLDATIGAGLVEREGDKFYNTYVVAMPDGRWARHRKLHVFVSPFLSPGNEYTVFDTPHGVRVGVLICYDNNLIENARATALAGAEILLSPHQTGGCKSGSPFAMGRVDVELWERRKADPESLRREFQGDKGRGWLMRWLPARAHDNGMFLLFSNGVGRDDDEVRTGNAMILDCYGRTLAESKSIEDDVIVADLDLSLRERATGTRWIKARRPELYGSLTQRTGREQETRAVRFEYDKE